MDRVNRDIKKYMSGGVLRKLITTSSIGPASPGEKYHGRFVKRK